MLSDMEVCTFREVPDGGLFIEIISPKQTVDLDQDHDVHEKYGDHELVLAGCMSNGVVRLNPRRGEPTPDHINARSPVVFVSRDRIERRAA